MSIYDPLAWTIILATIATIYAVAVTLILLKESAADAASIDYLIRQLAEKDNKLLEYGEPEWIITHHPSKARDDLAKKLVQMRNDELCINQNSL